MFSLRILLFCVCILSYLPIHIVCSTPQAPNETYKSRNQFFFKGNNLNLTIFIRIFHKKKQFGNYFKSVQDTEI